MDRTTRQLREAQRMQALATMGLEGALGRLFTARQQLTRDDPGHADGIAVIARVQDLVEQANALLDQHTPDDLGRPRYSNRTRSRVSWSA